MTVFLMGISANAQGPDAGGLWCYVEVDLKHDPTEAGWAYYEITTPMPNGDSFHVTSGGELLCVGPGRPRLVDRFGTIYLKLFLDDIEFTIMGAEYGTCYVDVNSTTMVPVLGWWMGVDYVPKYYTIQLQVKNTDW